MTELVLILNRKQYVMLVLNHHGVYSLKSLFVAPPGPITYLICSCRTDLRNICCIGIY